MEQSYLERVFELNSSDAQFMYNQIIQRKEKPYNGGDSDHKLIILIDSINNDSSKFTTHELSIISSLIRIRRMGVNIEFCSIYPVLNDLLADETKRESYLNTIKELIGSTSSIHKVYTIDNPEEYGSPAVKHERTNFAISPTSDNEGVSTSYPFEMIFGWKE